MQHIAPCEVGRWSDAESPDQGGWVVGRNGYPKVRVHEPNPGEWGGSFKMTRRYKTFGKSKEGKHDLAGQRPNISGPQGQLGGVARGPDRGPDRPTVSVGILGRGTSVGI